MESYICLALAIALSCTSVRGQECPAIQESELGSTTTPGTSGLVVDAITLGDSGSGPDILVLDSQTVCLAVGPTRDRYRYASVVVSFNCSGSLAPGNALGIPSCDGELTVQFDFECVSGPQWQRALTLGGDNVFNPSDGSLTTPLKTDCSFCVDPAIAGSLGLTADVVTHCADCDASCTGLMSCTGVLSSACCNYYESDTCTTMCTSPLVPDASNNCVMDCGSLSDPTNGQVNFTTTTEGSVANYTCDTGYDLVGDTTRTCQNDGQWSGSEPTCQIVDCGNGTLNNPTDGQVSFTTTTFSSTATYSCNTGYNLQGVATRTCQADGIWSDSEPTCQIIDCGSLTDPSNGTVSVSATTYTSNATYTCDSGYTINGDSMRMCQADGEWSGSEPSCLCDVSNCKECGVSICRSCQEGYKLSNMNTACVVNKDEEEDDDDLALIIGVVLAGFLVLLALIIMLIIAAFVAYHWKGKKKRAVAPTGSETEEKPLDSMTRSETEEKPLVSKTKLTDV